ncbi:aromatic acid exporter family protein [Evansella clarkii]|uniref:aromatic acid exporter family protein n=1 Tax=Evansella clarkii TaxID=79879 RepID=UPI000998D4F0|nr:aromatic acid exporter family protein [Evansella clarkii]
MFRIGYRTIKTALGASLAIAIAQFLQLDYFASAAIIAILCVQKTRRSSLSMSWIRFAAAIIGMVYAAVIFELLGYHFFSLGVFLLLFIPTMVALRLQVGIVTSAVIILHIYSYGAITAALIANELALIIIGVGCALLMNIYMPSVENDLSNMQNRLEELYSKIFHEFAVYIKNGESSWDGREITEAADLLQSAKNTAIQNLDNHILRYEDQYYHYFKMREKQLDIIERMMPLITSIDLQLKQGEMISDFIERLSVGVNPKNTAFIFINQLEELRDMFKEMPLPESRQEFEARAAMLQLVQEIEQYLLIKRQFKTVKNYSLLR